MYVLLLEPASHLPLHPLQVITEHWVELSVSYSSFSLATYFTYGNVYVKTSLQMQVFIFSFSYFFITDSESFYFLTTF